MRYQKSNIVTPLPKASIYVAAKLLAREHRKYYKASD